MILSGKDLNLVLRLHWVHVEPFLDSLLHQLSRLVLEVALFSTLSPSATGEVVRQLEVLRVLTAFP